MSFTMYLMLLFIIALLITIIGTITKKKPLIYLGLALIMLSILILLALIYLIGCM